VRATHTPDEVAGRLQEDLGMLTQGKVQGAAQDGCDGGQVPHREAAAARLADRVQRSEVAAVELSVVCMGQKKVEDPVQALHGESIGCF
jgi:hypothetical protein